MKKIVPFFIFILIILSSCEKTSRDVIFKINDDHEYKYSDIEMYDSSAHILYFKNEHPEFRSIEKGTFTFLDEGETVYTGYIWPSYSSLGPKSPFIMAPLHTNAYTLTIQSWVPAESDVRNNPRIMSVFSRYNLLHNGLSVTSGSVETGGAGQLVFHFTVKNFDKSDLRIIDINKTGPNLFHYFTNGLYIYDSEDNEVFTSTINVQQADPWDSWSDNWLSTIKTGESKDFTITYPLNKTIGPGDYRISFMFPGFSYQISRDQLYQGDSRIWMGSVSFRKHIAIP
jgi:hypothetical protein